MTREDFLNGVSFKIKGPTYKGDWTFKYQDEMVVRESRSSTDERVLTFAHHCNVLKVGKVRFKGFTYVFNKRVNVNIRFEELFRFK